MAALNDLILQNPWWKEKKVAEIFLGRERKEFFHKIEKFLPLRQALLIYGLRRTGKTTFFYQLIQKLILSGVNPQKIIYFSFDEKESSLRDVLGLYELKVLQEPITENTQLYLFLDEIQKLEAWQERVKVIYDRYPKIKIFLSGSASINLQKSARESLAGRVFEFEFIPLSFTEFLEWKGIKLEEEKLDFYRKELKLLIREYILKGGFPEIVEEKDKEIIRRYLKSSVLDKIIGQDLPLKFGLRDPAFLKSLVENFFSQPGTILNYDKLASEFQRSKITVINYIFYLKYALLLREVRNFRPSLRISSRKGKKIYPYNPAFCSIYLSEEANFKKVLETAVVTFFEAKYYYRNRFEVDFVLRQNNQIFPVEVKSGKAEVAQVKKFLEKFGSPQGFIISEDYEIQQDKVKVVPFWKVLVQNQLI